MANNRLRTLFWKRQKQATFAVATQKELLKTPQQERPNGKLPKNSNSLSLKEFEVYRNAIRFWLLAVAQMSQL